jgi:hypothetical protein
MRAHLVLLGMAALGARCLAGVLVVDFTGAGDFTMLAPAVAAAGEGDTILVRTHVDDEFVVIDGKSLTIVGDVPPGSTLLKIVPGVFVRNLVAGQQVTLRNLAFSLLFFSIDAALDLQDDAGGVWVENCTATGAEGNGDGLAACFTGDYPGGAGVRAVNCSSVVIAGCSLVGGVGADAFDLWPLHLAGQATDGGAGLLVQSSTVAVYETSMQAGKGGSGHLCSEVADGGPGVRAIASKLLLAGCTATGGVQGAGPPAGAPGDGVRGDAASAIEVLDSSATPAPGGAAFATAPGTLTMYAGSSRVLRITSPVREGQAGTLTLQGVQGDFVGFFWSFMQGLLPMPARHGWFLLNSSFIAGPFLVGVITAPSGVWELPFVAPDLGAGLEAQTFLMQAWFQSPGDVTLASGTAFTLLDATF